MWSVQNAQINHNTHRSGAGIKNQQKNDHMQTWTFYLRQLSLFARLSYYFIAVLGLTKSSTLLSALRFGQHSASFHMVIHYVTDIFFPKWALLERCAQFLEKRVVNIYTKYLFCSLDCFFVSEL